MPSPLAQRIHDLVRETPGLHFRAVGRAAGIVSTGQLRHHLDRLVRRGLVNELGDGRYRRYFPVGHAPDLQPQLARLARPLPRRIVRLLLAGPMGRTAMRRALDCADSTLGYHLQRMLRQGDLQQHAGPRGRGYVLADPARVRRALVVQETSPFTAGGMTPLMLPTPTTMHGSAGFVPGQDPLVHPIDAAPSHEGQFPGAPDALNPETIAAHTRAHAPYDPSRPVLDLVAESGTA